ncbi:MAG: PHP domain-containing protein [Bacillota bacterium]
MININLREERKEARYFAVYPRIVPTGEVSRIYIKSLFAEMSFEDDKKYEVTYKPKAFSTEREKKSSERKFKLKPKNGVLEIEQYFSGEQEHILIIEEKVEGELIQIGKFHIYSLQPDLFARRPLKGDLHLHSCRSDGEGSPAYMMALGRKIGFDFIALTDHGQYQPSQEAIKAYEDIDLDLLLVHGEEVHPPDSDNHLVNFGGNYSVNQLYTREEEKYEKEIREIIDSTDFIPEGVDEYEYASFVWSSEQIKKADGLAIFCHPYWVAGDQFYISEKLTSFLLKKQPFAALEIINGSISLEANQLQVRKYFAHISTDNFSGTMPVVGVSDAHHCDLGSGYSLVFAESKTREDIIKSIKQNFSLAVENQNGGFPRFYGSDRLVKYAYFLQREVFPEHDKLCFEEGSCMVDLITEKEGSKSKLENLSGRVDHLYQKYWK